MTVFFSSFFSLSPLLPISLSLSPPSFLPSFLPSLLPFFLSTIICLFNPLLLLIYSPSQPHLLYNFSTFRLFFYFLWSNLAFFSITVFQIILFLYFYLSCSLSSPPFHFIPTVQLLPPFNSTLLFSTFLLLDLGSELLW